MKLDELNESTVENINHPTGINNIILSGWLT